MSDKPKFDPNQAFQVASDEKPKFDPGKPFDEVPTHSDVQDPEDVPGPIEAGIRGTGQGLTFGFGDEAAAGLQAGLDVATSDRKMSELKKLYQEYKQLQQEREDNAQKANPKTYLGTELAGSLGTALLPGGQVNTVGKAAKLGALYGLGKSKADLTSGEVGQAAKDTAIGGALGTAGGLIGKGVSSLASRVGLGTPFRAAGEGLEQEGQDVALNALGAKAKDFKKERGLSMFTDPDYRKGIGKEALDKIGMGGPEAVQQKAVGRIREIEDIKNPLLEHANNELQNIKQFPTSGELDNLAKGSLSDSLGQLKDSVIGHKESLGLDTGAMSGTFDNIITALSGKDNDILALNTIKKSISKELGSDAFKKTSQELPEQAEFLKKSYGLVQRRIEDLADKAGPELGQKIKALNQEESNLLDLGNIAFETSNKESAKQSNSLLDYLAFGAGTTAGTSVGGPMVGMATGAATLAAKKGLERAAGWNLQQLGKIGAAKALQGAGQLGQKVGELVESPALGTSIARPVLDEKKEQEMRPVKLSQELYSASNDDLQSLSTKLQSEPKYASYGQALNQAITDGLGDKKNAILFSMLQNPNIRKYINGDE